MPAIKIRSSKRCEFVGITSEIERLVPADMKTGLCHVFCVHTTAGLTINENADPDVVRDIIGSLEKVFPWESPLYRHAEGNSAAHVKASLMGFSQTIPVEDGRLRLGRWQDVYFCEFDGPRERTVHVTLING